MLDRLAKKGFVVRNLDGRAWLYRPATSRATQIASEMLDLMGRLSEEERREVLSKIVAKIPVGRLGQASEIARAVTFLCSENGAFITGSTLSINGGQHMY